MNLNKITTKRNKKSSHIEEILSFVFFITFIMFLFLFIKYPQSDKEIKSIMSILESSINDQTKEEITKVYITNTTIKTSENCIEVNESFLEGSAINSTLKGSDGSNINSKRNSGKIYFDWDLPQSFFIAYYSKYGFNNTELIGSLTCQTGEIKTVLSEKKFIEQKITNLINDTELNYTSTKVLLGVSSKYDFNIQFEYENKTKIGKNVTETNTNLYVKENLVEYLDLNANEKTGKIIIYIW